MTSKESGATVVGLGTAPAASATWPLRNRASLTACPRCSVAPSRPARPRGQRTPAHRVPPGLLGDQGAFDRKSRPADRREREQHPHHTPVPDLRDASRAAALTSSGTGVRFDHESDRTDVTVIMVCKPAPIQADRTRHQPASTPRRAHPTSRDQRRHPQRSGMSSLIDADVAPAVGGVRLAVPPSPSVAQSYAGDASHEVELGRVGHAHPDRMEDEAVGADLDMVLVEDLRDGVVPACWPTRRETRRSAPRHLEC